LNSSSRSSHCKSTRWQREAALRNKTKNKKNKFVNAYFSSKHSLIEKKSSDVFSLAVKKPFVLDAKSLTIIVL
jgi:hypothetical protein